MMGPLMTWKCSRARLGRGAVKEESSHSTQYKVPMLDSGPEGEHHPSRALGLSRRTGAESKSKLDALEVREKQ